MNTPQLAPIFAIGGTVVVTVVGFILLWRYGGKEFSAVLIRASKALQVEDLRAHFATKGELEDARKEARDAVDDLGREFKGYQRFNDDRMERLEREIVPVLRSQTDILREVSSQIAAHTQQHKSQEATMQEVKEELRRLRDKS